MNDIDARKFDSLHKLHEIAWREWDNKSKHEWKLSFGIWGALLAATASVIESSMIVEQCFLIILPIIILSVHLYFLSWIRYSMNFQRTKMNSYSSEMNNLTSFTSIVRIQNPFFDYASIFTQLSITALLIFIFIKICLSKVGA